VSERDALEHATALLERTYAAFNARDIDAVLAVMHPDVDWPNGMDGGRVHRGPDGAARLRPGRRVDPQHGDPRLTGRALRVLLGLYLLPASK
jgi:ketosteroid isomerase-like protein